VEQRLKLIILVTGESGAGKDYCTNVWVSVLNRIVHNNTLIQTRVVSISDVTKREYAAATSADLNRLLSDRAYKEEHRPALTSFFKKQVQQRPWLAEEHFLDVVYSAVDVDVLLITGMRETAPLVALSHLVPHHRLLEVYVRANEQTRRIRRGICIDDGNGLDNQISKDSESESTSLDYWPSFIFTNDKVGDEEPERFVEDSLLRFFHDDLQRLADMVRSIPDFPRTGIEFRHVLGISQQPGGLTLCVSLLQTHFKGGWGGVEAVVCCEAGGFIFASALASRMEKRLVLIREAGKLPPPIVSMIKPRSHISSVGPIDIKEKRIEIEEDVIHGYPVVVVDDVLATGETLCAVLQLLIKAGLDADDVSVIVVAEFPIHRGRDLLHRRGFGKVRVQSLLVFGGA
jgi:adenine phosphoribosyltransferase